MKTIFVILWLYSSVPFTIGTMVYGPGWWQAYQFKTMEVCEQVIEALKKSEAQCLPVGIEPKGAGKPLS